MSRDHDDEKNVVELCGGSVPLSLCLVLGLELRLVVVLLRRQPLLSPHDG